MVIFNFTRFEVQGLIQTLDRAVRPIGRNPKLPTKSKRATRKQTNRLNIIRTVFIYSFAIYNTNMTVLL